MRRVLLPALLGIALTSLPASAQAADSHVDLRDPGADVKVSIESATQAQRRTVDLRTISYDIAGDDLTITQGLRDLEHTPGNQFAETTVTGRLDDGSSYSLVITSELSTNKVMLFDGDHYYRCQGATLTTLYRSDRIKQVVPIDTCLAAFDTVSLRTSATLATKNGSPIVSDKAHRVTGVDLR